MDHYSQSGGNNRIELITNVFINPDSDQWEAKNWKERIIASLTKVPTKADSLKPLLQMFVAAISPSKIYLLEHKTINENEAPGYFDLLLVIPNSIPFTEIEPILEIAYLRDHPVCCSLHNEGSVLEGLKNGHSFYSLNCIPENLVYDSKVTKFPTTTSEVLAQMKQAARETFMRGFEKAKYFYECAETIFNNCHYELALFMLHQAVEMTCRSMLQSLNGYTKKTHEIRVLRKHIRRCAPQLLPIFNDDTEEEKNLLDTLEKGYTDARYEHQYKVEKTDLTLLFEKVKLFQDTAFGIVEQKTALS